MVMSIDVTTAHDLMRQQRLANMTSIGVVKKVIIERTALVQLAQAQYQTSLQCAVLLLA